MTYLLNFIDNHMLIYYNPINNPSEWFSYGSDGWYVTPNSVNNFINGKYNNNRLFIQSGLAITLNSSIGNTIKYSGVITNIGRV